MLFRRNVFVLGAGFSADAGAPVMKNFLQKARHLLDDPGSGLGDPDREAFRRVFAFLRDLRAAEAKITLDLENIEHLFGLAEMDLEFGGGDKGGFRRDLIFLILRTLERSIRIEKLPRGMWQVVTKEANGQRYSRGVEAHYGELFAALATRRWVKGAHGIPQNGTCQDTIITMNYDCFLDDALLRLGVAPDYALPDAVYPREFAGIPYRVSLLKLHGSANWFRCGLDYCKPRVWEGESARRLDYFYGVPCPACHLPVEPVIVPPTWAKGGYRDMFDPVWKGALRALREAGQIFLIGYSVPDTDAFFQYMLGLALATNEDIDQVVVVNRDPEIKQKFGRLFQQHFRERRLAAVDLPTLAYVTSPQFGEALGQYQEGLDREMIEASGVRVA